MRTVSRLEVTAAAKTKDAPSSRRLLFPVGLPRLSVTSLLLRHVTRGVASITDQEPLLLRFAQPANEQRASKTSDDRIGQKGKGSCTVLLHSHQPHQMDQERAQLSMWVSSTLKHRCLH